MSDTEKPETSDGPLQETYQPEPTDDRGYTPFTQRPAGKPPKFSPPSGSGAPSGGGEPQDQSSGGGEDSGDSEKE